MIECEVRNQTPHGGAAQRRINRRRRLGDTVDGYRTYVLHLESRARFDLRGKPAVRAKRMGKDRGRGGSCGGKIQIEKGEKNIHPRQVFAGCSRSLRMPESVGSRYRS